MKNNRLKYQVIINFIIILCFAIFGCKSSDQSTDDALTQQLDATEKMLKDVKAENESLKIQITKLEQEKRAATAHIAELETRLTEMKERLTVQPQQPTKPTIIDVRESYKEALKLFRSRNYQEATTILQTLLDSDIPTQMQDNCHYWLGECSFGLKKYNDAIEHFQKVFTFKISEKKDESQIMIANSYLAMGNKAKAKEEYEKLIKKFPASPFVKRVKEKLGTFSK